MHKNVGKRCEFCPVINAKIEACIKSIGNHAKKSYLALETA